MNFNDIGGRKFALAILIVLIVSGLVGAGKIGEGTFAQLCGLVVAVYVGGNVAQKVLGKEEVQNGQ